LNVFLTTTDTLINTNKKWENSFEQQVYRPPPSPVVNGFIHKLCILLVLFFYFLSESEKLLDKPWRDIEWTAEKLLNEIKRYKPSVSSVKQARILLVGPIGVGKSSFFNSINSVFHGHITSQAVAGTTLESSFRTYQVEAGQDGEPLPFILCDTMGLEEGLAQGLNIEDIPNILNGKIGDRYQFNPASPLEDSNSSNPEKLEDKIHCVVYVLDVSKMGLIPEKLFEKIRTVQKKVNGFGVPQVLLLTKVDQTCPPVEKDIQKVYHSEYLQAKVRFDASARLGIPLLSVFPVKNYTREVELQQNDDILLLSALQKILHFADDYMRDMNDKSECSF
uniref:G domain-containing protein n=1 Tax=Scleropages formosus TaxID=113540 RepID=A0A8C9WQ36_SCLFO